MSANQTTNNAALINDEYHVASFVAHVLLKQMTAVKHAIEAVDGAEIHGENTEGKIIFTLESHSHKSIGKKIDRLREHHGFINIFPVYHQYEKA